MNPTFQHKKELRGQILKQRESFSPEWLNKNSAQIHSNLKSLPAFDKAKIIHTYVDWKNEVRTQSLIAELLETGKRVIVPVVDKNADQLKHSEIKSLSDLEPGAFGIMEPKQNPETKVDIETLDVILVPGVAFDTTGHRLGYGGGYYDAFLKQTTVLKIALGFEFQIVEKIPTREEDEKIDILVTEKRIYEFR